MMGAEETAPGDPAERLARAANSQERFEIMYSTLRDRICLLTYPPGMQLSEEALAQEFGVSRSPLRKALKILEADGLIQSRQGVGTLVTDVDIEELSQVYQLRMELSEMTARLLPSELDGELRGKFEAMYRRAGELVETPSFQGFARLNIDFFHCFQLLSGNRPLQEVSERLFYLTCRIWLRLVGPEKLSQEIGIFCGEIFDITEAIRLGDVKAAALIRRAHLSMSYTRLVGYSGKTGA
jgi:DNA-binding GntR family transcriptional regulator